MGNFNRILVVLLFGGMMITAYAGSVMGWGMGGLRNQRTMSQIRNNCPQYYQTHNGRCLGTTFRSYYIMRGVTGGGFGSGK